MVFHVKLTWRNKKGNMELVSKNVFVNIYQIAIVLHIFIVSLHFFHLLFLLRPFTVFIQIHIEQNCR